MAQAVYSRVLGMVFGVCAVGALLGALACGLRPEAQEAAVNRADDVTPQELQLYIDVYSAMQADHGLTLDQVLGQKGVSLAEFRSVERRVQREDRLVRKVREALLAQAKARGDQLGAFAATPAAPPPGQGGDAPP